MSRQARRREQRGRAAPQPNIREEFLRQAEDALRAAGVERVLGVLDRCMRCSLALEEDGTSHPDEGLGIRVATRSAPAEARGSAVLYRLCRGCDLNTKAANGGAAVTLSQDMAADLDLVEMVRSGEAKPLPWSVRA